MSDKPSDQFAVRRRQLQRQRAGPLRDEHRELLRIESELAAQDRARAAEVERQKAALAAARPAT